MIVHFLRRLAFYGSVVFFMLLLATPLDVYAQKKDPLVTKSKATSRKRLRAQQARMQRWEREYAEFLNRRRQRGSIFQGRQRRRIGNAASLYAQPTPYAGRKFRTEAERVGENPNVVSRRPSTGDRPTKSKRIRPRSTSGRFLVQKKAKPYRFRGKDKWEQTYSGKYYGRRSGIQPRNTQRVRFSGTVRPYEKRGRLGDKPYSGYQSEDGYISATKRGQRAWKGDIAGRKIQTRSSRPSVTAAPSKSPYVKRGRNVAGKDKPDKSGRVNVRSASGRFIVNKKAKPYQLKDVKKWEDTYKGKYYGRREGVNPRSTQRISANPRPEPYKNRGRLGDKPFIGKWQSGYISATKKGERAWEGDISGHKLRKSKFKDNQQVGQRIGKRAIGAMSASGGLHNNQGRAVSRAGSGGSISSRMKRDNDGRSIMPFVPGKDARRATLFSGNMKGQRDIKGGGSISGRMIRDNNGRAIISNKTYDRTPNQYEGTILADELRFKFDGSYLNYSGNIKARRPEKGGGSISAKMMRDNNGRAIVSQKNYDRRPNSYSGNIKARRPEKGGGSLSRDGWNNDGQALPQRYADSKTRMIGSFSGNMKAKRPETSGGSLSRGSWNNDGKPLPQRYADNKTRMIGSFSGNMKAKRPEKGGGSISRDEPWNNNESAIARKYDKKDYTSHTGDIRLKSDYARNKNSSRDAILVRKPGKNYYAAASFTGNVRERRKVSGKMHSSTFFYTKKSDGSATEEKDKTFSFKLLWNKLFGSDKPKNDKVRKPRYDKGEKGIWYE